VKKGHDLKNIGSRVMGLVDNDVAFDGEYIYSKFQGDIAQVVLKLWVKCIFCLTQNLSKKRVAT
jgi:hypothetical protein